MEKKKSTAINTEIHIPMVCDCFARAIFSHSLGYLFILFLEDLTLKKMQSLFCVLLRSMSNSESRLIENAYLLIQKREKPKLRNHYRNTQ